MYLTGSQVLAAAVDGDALSGDKGGVLGGQERDELVHLLRLSHSAQGSAWVMFVGCRAVCMCVCICVCVCMYVYECM